MPSRLPLAAYWLAALILYAVIALGSVPTPWTLAEIDWDIWQHLAALDALIKDPLNPGNPFIPTGDPSRLFGPVHVALGFIGHALGWSQVQAFGAAAILSLVLLATGQFAFARAYFPDRRWAPLALLTAMTLGWWVSFLFPGYSSPLALFMGAGYPASVAVGFTLLSWAWAIRLLARPSVPELAGFALFVALQFDNHQLGAGIALIGVGCFGLLQPAAFRARAMLAAATLIGLALSALWPWFNPFTVMRTVGYQRWNDYNIDFYSARIMFQTLFPALVGVFWLRRPLLAALALYTAAYALGLWNSPTSHRFLAPMALVGQIGLAQALLNLRDRWYLALFAIVPLAGFQAQHIEFKLRPTRAYWAKNGNMLERGARLLADNPTGVAGYLAAAWPAVASGHRVYVTPFTEPLIPDQLQRWQRNTALFLSPIDPDKRLAMAHAMGVTVLIAQRGYLPAAAEARIRAASAKVTTDGPLERFDLKPQPPK